MRTDVAGPDVTKPEFFTRPDYFDVLARLRAEAPVCRSTHDTWMVTRYDDIRSISRDPATFSSKRGVIINDPSRDARVDIGDTSVIHMDPPDHSAYRKLVNGEFTPRAVGRLEEAVRDTVRTVLDGLPRNETFDGVAAVTAPIPVLVIANLLDIGDGALGDFRRWSDEMIHYSDDPSDGGTTAGLELFNFLDGHIASRYADPGTDLISLLTGAEFKEAPLNRMQILMFCLTLLVAGNETTRHLLSGGLQVLAEHPDQRARLAEDPAGIPIAVEEMLRWITPIQAMARTTTRSVELRGEHVPEGDYVVMLYASGNRDAEVWGPTADRFDAARPVNTTHVAFGFGEHLCLGAPLARLEARVFWEEMLASYPNYVIERTPDLVPSTLVRGPAELSLSLA